MSTKISVYLGIGKFNKGDISAHGTEFSQNESVGNIAGSEGFERLKLCNSVIELGELPDIDALVSQRHSELVQAELERHQAKIAELEQIKAA